MPSTPQQGDTLRYIKVSLVQEYESVIISFKLFLLKFLKLNSFCWFLALTIGLLFIPFDILPSSCHSGLTTFNIYSWKLKREEIVVMRQMLQFKFSKNIIMQKYIFSSSDLDFGPKTCHSRIHTSPVENNTDMVENGCKARLKKKYWEVSKMWRMTSF